MSGPVLIAPVRGRLQQHFRRWSSRWSTVAADSFRRIDAQSLGSADTGHGWGGTDSTPAAASWRLVGSRAYPSGLADTTQVVPLGSGNVRISCGLIVASDPAATRLGGLIYRSLATGQYGWAAVYQGAGVLALYQFNQNVPVWNQQTTFAVPAITVGAVNTLEMRLLGTSHVAYWNGAQVGTWTDGTYAANTWHGLAANNNVALGASFAAFRCTRYVG